MNNVHITNKIVVVVAAPPSRAKVENAVGAAFKKPTNYNNSNHKHGMQQNVPKNTFHQQVNAKSQKPHGNTTKPQQQNCTNVKVLNQTNLQLGGNSKSVSHGEQRKNNNHQNTFKTNSSKSNFHQQHGNTTKPQQQNCTNVKVANQTNLQLGGNSKSISHGEQRKNDNHQNTFKTNSSKSTFHQQHGNTTKPQQQNCTNVKVANQTNLQLGNNSKPSHHKDQKKNNPIKNQEAFNTNSGNKVHSRNHKTSNNKQIIINVQQTNVIINK